MIKANKLPSGQWRCQVVVGRRKNGTRDIRSVTFDTPEESELQAAILKVKYQKLKITDLTFREAFAKYIEIKKGKISPASIREYSKSLRKDFQNIMDKKLYDITQEDIQNEIDELCEKNKPKTVHDKHSRLSMVFSKFRPDFRLTTELPKIGAIEYCIPDDNDIKKIQSVIKNTEMEIPVLLAACCCMRREEVCGLKYSDIDYDKNTLYIHTAIIDSGGKYIESKTKTVSSTRVIEAPEFLIKKIGKGRGPVTELNPDEITKRFEHICIKAKVRHYTFHSLRHYSASIMHALGIPDAYIMAYGGWKSDKTLKQVYINALESNRKEFDKIATSHFDLMMNV